LLLVLLFLGTFDVHRRDWRALLRRMRLLRLGHKRQIRKLPPLFETKTEVVERDAVGVLPVGFY
jgi:hypothetical protein